MLRTTGHILLWMVSGAFFLGALGIVVFATPLFGNRMLIVRSGSMEPAMSVGDVVVVREPRRVQGWAGYQVGDAIAFNVPGRENMVVTHRIVEVRGNEYVTKGDANQEADSWAITQKDIVGRELFVVPWLGTLLAFAKSRVGFLSLVVAPALIVILSEMLVIWREIRKKISTFAEAASHRPILDQGNPSIVPPLLSRRKIAGPSLVKGRLGGISVSALSFVGSPPPPVRIFVDGIVRRGVSLAALVLIFSIMTPATFALYTDTGTSSNNTFTAADDFGGIDAGDVVISEIMWMGSSTSTADEWIELRNMTSDSIDVTGWKILNAGESPGNDITLSGTIAGNGYWLLGNNNAATSAMVNTITVDQVTTAVGLSNGGEQLTLKDPGGTTIDASPVTSGSWPHGDNSPDQQSMSRNDPPGDGTVSGNWHTCTDVACNDTTYWDAEGDDFGTPKATNL